MLEFLFKYPPLLFEKGRIVFASPLPAWLLAIAVLLTAALGWGYLRASSRLPPRERAVLVAMRASLLALLLLALFRPTLQVPVSVPQENYLGILIDDSRSMRIADGDAGPRGEQLRALLDEQLLGALSDRFRLRVFRFAGDVERAEGAGDLAFAGGQTRIGQALERARAELAGVPLAGLVVVTDGADQAEAELNAALLGLRSGAVPVHTVGVGRESFARDVEVRRVNAPRSVLRGTSMVMDLLVAQTGYAGRTVPLVVEDEGAIVESLEVELPRDGTPAAVRVHFTASDPGWRRFRFRVPVQDGELVRENNQQEALVEVRDGRQKILYLEGEPRFEVKFLRRAVEDDPQLQLVVLQRTAADKFLRLDVDSAAELASGFPATREELFSYRALVLGSVEAGFFTREQLRMIVEFVGERGGSLLTLGGRRAFAEGGYAGTPLADVLPVELEERPDTLFYRELSVAPTRAGQDHPVLQIAATSAESRARWAALPPLSTFNRLTRVKPGATALLTGSGPGVPEGQVVLAAQRFGRGLSLAFPVQDSWVWQMHADIPLEDGTHETLWRQLLRWLVNEVPDPLTVAASAEPAALDRPVQIRAELRDGAYRRVNDGVLTAWVEGPGGGERELPLRWTAQRDGEYLAAFAPAAPGLHRIRVEARRGGDAPVAGSLTLDAVEDQGEFFAAQMRAPLLRRISEETGGRFYTLADLPRLTREVEYSGSGVTRVESYDLWDMPIVFLLLLGLIGGEWAYRRRKGLP